MTPLLDIEQPDALLAYLRSTGRIAPNEPAQARVLAGGVSNRTVLLTRPTGEAWVLKQALPKLRVQVDWFSPPERVHQEALGLRCLQALAPSGAVPEFVFEDEAHHLLAMQAVPQPHENWKTMLLAGRLELGQVRQAALLLAGIHRQAFARAAELSPVFGDRSFFESLRLEPYYGYTAAQVPAAAAFLRALIADTRSRPITLVHGDFSPKNLLCYQGRLILLDHEVIHWGDPAFDVGFFLTHLFSKANHLTSLQRDFAIAATSFWLSYSDALKDLPWRAGLENWALRHTLGCLLARVAGRSPLEYLNRQKRLRQQQAVTQLLAAPPNTFTELITRFLSCLEFNA
jgi:aminoglycoside phosphotransferase (APT) family kinase protein